MNSRDILVLMHTHWDREWYFTKDETKTILRNHMQEVIEFLENNKDVIYILDGQSVMIDDFLEFSPNWENRLEKLIKNNQLRVGPWYTQTDLLIVHGESIIRNLYYGIRTASKYGNVMKVGYAPDTFGHSSQMPQIYNQFNIDSTFFWRGFSELKANKADFIWKGVDGTEIFGINLSTGYQGAKYLENEYDALKKRIEKIMNVLDKYSVGNARLIMNGHDQMPIQKDIFKILEMLKEIYPNDSVRISDFETYVESIKDEKLEIVSGELTHSKHARIHRTINSTRMDIKLLNSEIEYKLFNILEPLSVLATNLGIEYPHAIFEKCFKELFGIHAHDSIGGCNSDKVNQDIKQRLICVKEIVDTQIELYMRLISMSGRQEYLNFDSSYIKQENKNIITVYNLLPYKRENEYVEVETITRSSDFIVLDDNGKEVSYTLLSQEKIDAGLIDRQVAARLLDIKVFKSKIKFKMFNIDGLSIKYFSYVEGLEFNNVQSIETNKNNTIENKYYKITLEANSINIENKITKEIIENAIFIENSGDAGDSYDYSPPIDDFILNSNIYTIENISKIETTDVEMLSFDLEMLVPENQLERSMKKCSQKMKFRFLLELDKDSQLIKIKLSCENRIYDSRFRIVLDTRINSNIVESDSHLSVVRKKVYLDEELSIWEKDNWVEKPVSIETYQSYVSLSNNYDNYFAKRATIFSMGLKEYEVIDSKIYLTLFRSFSHLGKRELVNRPGRPSGIEIETPDNQLIGEKFDFEFAVVLEHNGEVPAKISKELLTPINAYQLKEFNRFNLNVPIKSEIIKSKLNLDMKKCVVSTLKLREDSNDIFIRLFNPTYESIELQFNGETFVSNPLEEIENKIQSYVIKPQEILNLIIKKK